MTREDSARAGNIVLYMKHVILTTPAEQFAHKLGRSLPLMATRVNSLRCASSSLLPFPSLLSLLALSVLAATL